MKRNVVRVADEVWIVVAHLHRRFPDRDDFSISEIMKAAHALGVTGTTPLRPSLKAHVYHHCVANREPSPGRYKMLLETGEGRRRLFRPHDPCHPLRAKGKTQPDSREIPKAYTDLIPWYGQWCGVGTPPSDKDPLLGLKGLGQRLEESEGTRDAEQPPVPREQLTRRVFWDTGLFALLLEGADDVRTNRVVTLRKRMLHRGDQLLMSSLTLSAVLEKPMQMGREDLMREYEELIGSGATVIPFDQAAASTFAWLRQDHSIQPHDAYQLACASVVGVDLFVVDDNRLQGKLIPGIESIQSIDKVRI